MTILTDTKGRRWRLDTVIDGKEAHKAQIYPGYTQLNISPEDSDTPNQQSITLPDWMAQDWINGRIKLGVRK